MSSFDLHPILDAGQAPRPGVWYALSPEGESEAPCARVGACASFLPGENGGRVVLTCGATPEGPFSDMYQLTLSTGDYMVVSSLVRHRQRAQIELDYLTCIPAISGYAIIMVGLSASSTHTVCSTSKYTGMSMVFVDQNHYVFQKQ